MKECDFFGLNADYDTVHGTANLSAESPAQPNGIYVYAVGYSWRRVRVMREGISQSLFDFIGTDAANDCARGLQIAFNLPIFAVVTQQASSHRCPACDAPFSEGYPEAWRCPACEADTRLRAAEIAAHEAGRQAPAAPVLFDYEGREMPLPPLYAAAP